MDEEGFKKARIKEKKKRGGIQQPFYGIWVADLMLRQDAGRFMLGKYLSDKKIPWQRRRRLGMAIAGNMQTASFLTKIGKMQSAGCRLCRIARRMKHTVTSTVHVAKEWQQQLWQPTTPSAGICMTLHRSPRASSSLSFLTKKITCVRCSF